MVAVLPSICSCAALIWATGAVTATAASDDPSKPNQESAPPAVIISENVTTIIFPTSYFSGDANKAIDTTFVVRSASPTKQSIAITSSGLGGASFLIVGSGSAALQFVQTEVDENGKRIMMSVPRDLLPAELNSVEGKIVILAGSSKPVEAAVKIERRRPLLITSFQWYWALLVPAAIGALLTYVGTRLVGSWSARTAALTAFSKFKDDQYDMLSDFFTAFYPTASKHSDDEFAKNLNEELRKRNILAAIAERERRKLERVLRTRNRSQIERYLGKLFFEWSHCFVKRD